MSALRAAHKIRRQTYRESGLDVIAPPLRRTDSGPAGPTGPGRDDWSIELPEGCHCELCQTLGAFLGDPARRTFE